MTGSGQLDSGRQRRGQACRAVLLSALSAAVLCLAAPAHADLIQYTFSGELFFVQGDVVSPWQDVQVGDPYFVSYIVDSETPDFSPNPNLGLYEIESSVISIAGIAQEPGYGQIDIDAQSDVYKAVFIELPFEVGAQVYLGDPDFRIDSDDLLLDLQLAAFDTHTFQMILGNQFELLGSIDTLDIQVVPAPSALMVMGFVLLGFRRRTRAVI